MPNATLILPLGATRNYSVNFGNQPELRDQGMTLTTPAVTQYQSVPSTANALTIANVSVSLDLRQILFTISGGTDGAQYVIKANAALLLNNVATGLTLPEYLPLTVSSVL